MGDLFTVVILHYKQPEFFKTAVASLLNQDYQNIELVFADDCSGNLAEEEVREYIEQNKGSNIKNVIYQFNKENIGTIKNINKAIDNSKGKYILIFAADDKLYSDNVLSELVKAFDAVTNDVQLVTGQSIMMDSNLEKEIGNFVPERIVKECNDMTDIEQHTCLLYQSVFALGATAFKRSCFEKYGKFDEKLKVIEDWTFFLDYTANGGKVYYKDIKCLMHRAGGISEDGKNKSLSKIYYDDLNKIYEGRVLPFIKDEKDREVRCKILLHYKDIADSKIKVFKYLFCNINVCVYYLVKKCFGKKNEKK